MIGRRSILAMMECSVWVAAADHQNNTNSNDSSNNNLWGFSHESELDLALMVSDFLENNVGSAGGDSWCSSDSESGFSDLIHLADKISVSINSFPLKNWIFFSWLILIG